LLDFLVFDVPKSLFNFIKAEKTPKKREQNVSKASAQKDYSLTLYVTFVVFLDENMTFLK